MSKGLINLILNNIADLTNLQTGLVEIDLGKITTSGTLFNNSGSMFFNIPLGRVLPKNTTVTKVTGEMIVRAGSSNANGIFVWSKDTSHNAATFDSSDSSVLINASNTSKTITSNMWTELTIQGDCNIRVKIDTGENYFFSGDSTNNGYIVNQPCFLALYNLKVMVDIPTGSIYVPQATIVADAPSSSDSSDDIVDPVIINSSVLPGTIQMYAGSVAPQGYLICNGSAISRTEYSTLFSIIGTTYGTGNGSTTFNIPDLRGRTPIGVGTGTATGATTYILGQKAGVLSNSYTPGGTIGGTALTKAQLPSLTGSIRIRNTSNSSYNMITSASGIAAVEDYGSATGTVGYSTGTNTFQQLTISFGSGNTHTHTWTGTAATINNMQPYLAINYIIATGKDD